MPIPDYQSIMLPILEMASDGEELGLDVVYVQAKKWNSTEARQFVANIESKIVLIDGQQLTQFMFEHNVGVAPVSQYEVKKVDTDFFEEGVKTSRMSGLEDYCFGIWPWRRLRFGGNESPFL